MGVYDHFVTQKAYDRFCVMEPYYGEIIGVIDLEYLPCICFVGPCYPKVV